MSCDKNNSLETKYIQEYMLKSIYKILKVNLTSDTYEIIKASDDELTAEKGYHASSFSAWLEGLADSGLIYTEDLPAYRMHIDMTLLRRFFSFTDALFRIRYRRLVGDEYRWVMMEMVPSTEYEDDNQVVMLSVHDVDQDILELYETAKREQMLTQLELQYETIKSIASIYESLHVINMIDDTATEIASFDQLREYFNAEHNVSSQLQYAMQNIITQNDLENALAFTDLSTLVERLGDDKLISSDFVAVGLGWIRMQFIANSYTTSGKLMSVILTIRVIESEKQREANLIRISTTDELTRLYNRRSYEMDIEKYKTYMPEENLTVVLMDLNGLKHVNDNIGHTAGDELICGAAHSIVKAIGDVSKIYRIGGDEFAAIVHYDSDKISELKAHFDSVVSDWHGEFIDKLSIAWGHASAKDYPDKPFSELLALADKLMYEDKNRYYVENNLDRRRR